jgi:citrate lyase subunit beta/citryl-CoA lyase
MTSADTEDRFQRAAESGAGETILDLEHAIAASAKDTARDKEASWFDGQESGWVRINAFGTPWHNTDLAAAADRGRRRDALGVHGEEANDEEV